jgi:hypothetical protein
MASACAHRQEPVLADLAGREDLSTFRIQSVRGVRDGDRLDAQAIISDSSSILTMELHFAVGSPTKLSSVDFQWSRAGRLLMGTVTARSVTFLGGQDGPPSVGGAFDLMANDGSIYRVNLPLTALPRSFLPAPSGGPHP